MSRQYNKPELRRVPGKKSWYVVITKPVELQTRNNKQIRRSTGTTNEALAKKKMHSIASQVFSEWNDALQVDPLEQFLQSHWSQELQNSHGELKPLLQSSAAERVTVCLWVMSSKDEWQPSLAQEIYEYLTYEEASDWHHYLHRYDNPYPRGTKQHAAIKEKEEALATFIEELDGKDLSRLNYPVTASPAFNMSDAPVLSKLREEWLRDEVPWRNKTDKYKAEMAKCSLAVIKLLEDLPIDQLRTTHGTTLARALDAEGKANSTIKKYKLSLDQLIDWTLGNKENQTTVPATPWLLSNPLKGFSLSDYGSKKRPFQALPADQLHRLFNQEMLTSDRLLLSILLTTGMRLDEAALLTWEQLKVDRNGIRFFDLSMCAIVKNDSFSARTVAIPDCLLLPTPSTGKLFDFATNSDGKSSADASKHLNARYFHPIRYDKNDNRKVVHSLRHTLAGLMRNLRPTPSSEVMDWITGHGEQGSFSQSERVRTYNEDIDVAAKYEVVNKVRHPWLIQSA